jgi:hypothetical protein
VTQVLIGANNARKSVTTDDVRLGAGESVPPITREVIIDVMVRRPSSEY